MAKKYREIHTSLKKLGEIRQVWFKTPDEKLDSLRLTIFGSPDKLSDDAIRYVHELVVVLQSVGYKPYAPRRVDDNTVFRFLQRGFVPTPRENCLSLRQVIAMWKTRLSKESTNG